MLTLMILVSWLTIGLLLLQYGPRVINMFKSLVDAIREKNVEKGAKAVDQAGDLADQIVLSLQARAGLSNDEKREQAWKDLQAAASAYSIQLSETNARSLTQLAYQKLSGK